MGASLKLNQISREYAAPGGGTLAVLRSIDLEIPCGASAAIVGPSGSGKSTLLQIIGTLDRPSHGQVWLDGQDVAALPELELASIRNRKLGFVFQSHHLLPQCTVWENVLLPTLAGNLPDAGPETIVQRAERLLKRAGISERKHHRPGQLSGGERQRVAVVRALINQPGLLLADEPTGALDQASAGEIGQLLLELNREEGVTLIVVTHALDLARTMNQVYTLRGGTLSAGTPGL
jgi:ABC-type lipoprotein export system ATPase subunit